jgi:predicted dehydrogenase
MSKKLKIVLVGCGGISGAWLNSLKGVPDIDLVGLVDINKTTALKRAEEFGWNSAVISTDLNETLNHTAPDIVFDCTVPEAHVDVTLTALAHGCHVLGEKPLAHNMQAAQRMVKAAQASGKLYAITQTRRYDHNIRRFKAFLESGAIGQITTINTDFFIGAHFGGFRDQMQHVLILDMAIHTFDAARLISGENPLSVFCFEWNPPGSWYAKDSSAAAIFRMTNDVVFNYRGSWCAEGLNTTWESTWRVIGTQGSATWDGATGFQAQRVAARGGFFSTWQDIEVPDINANQPGGHAGVILDFLDCVRTGRIPETICTDNILSLAMVQSAIHSAESGAVVEITQ